MAHTAVTPFGNAVGHSGKALCKYLMLSGGKTVIVAFKVYQWTDYDFYDRSQPPFLKFLHCTAVHYDTREEFNNTQSLLVY